MSSPDRAATRASAGSGIPVSRKFSKRSRIFAGCRSGRRRRPRVGAKVEERLLVVAVPPRHDQGVCMRRDLERGEDLVDRAPRRSAPPRGKPFGVGVLVAVVDDPDVEIGFAAAARLATPCPTCPAPTITSRTRGKVGKSATPARTLGPGPVRQVPRRA